MNKSKLTLLTAALALATALTFSCSDDSGGGGNPVKKAKISGVSQKGPFTKGSAAILYELNNDLSQTGRIFQDIIADDKGNFEIKNVELVSPYALLKAEGYYRNEVTGQVSAAPITLYAIADVTDRDNVNVNLLTHLEYRRVMKLAEGGKSVREAKKQAQKEILAVFGISGDFIDSEDMSIFGTSEGDAALLAISVLLQRNLSEGNFSEQLSAFSLEFAESGTWDNETVRTAMADWAGDTFRYCYSSEACLLIYAATDELNCEERGNKVVVSCDNSDFAKMDLPLIKNNILAWGLSENVPAFEKYVNGFWADNYGLGECSGNREREIKLNENKTSSNMYYVCESGSWRAMSEFEIDTDGWDCRREQIIMNGSKKVDWCHAECVGHKTKSGNVSGSDYFCMPIGDPNGPIGAWMKSNALER